MNLIFLSKQDPRAEDFTNHYSRIRFYSDTIIKFAEYLKIESVTVSFPHVSNYLYEGTDEDFYKLENCSYLWSELSEIGVNCKFVEIDELQDDDIKDSLVIFGILNSSNRELKFILDSYRKVIKNSKGYYYLSSDGELSNGQYIDDKSIGYLDVFSKLDLDDVLRTKMIGSILTESRDKDLLNKYHSIGIENVYYLPFIIKSNHRVLYTKTKSFNEKLDKVMMIRNLKRWSNYPEVLKKFSGKLVTYDSSMPFYRKKLSDIIDKYGIEYKHARFWKLEKAVSLVTQYKYLLGTSIPHSDRFTYKLIESTDARTVCILPKLEKPLLFLSDSDISSIILRKYMDNLMTLDINNTDELDLNISESQYNFLLNYQNLFIKEYFDYNSDNINYHIEEIFTGSSL